MEGKVRLLRKKGVEVISIAGLRNYDIPLREILKILTKKSIASVMVEGGAEVNQKFLCEGLVDKLLVFIAPTIAGDGINAVSAGIGNRQLFERFRDVKTWDIDGDILVEAYA
jgi:riboflavin biosynthesis pyrimidine reductase